MRSKFQFLPIALALVLSGCAMAPKPVTAESVTGVYNMVEGGFNESLKVWINGDSTYTMEHKLIGCTDLSVTRRSEVGFWKWENGLVILEPRTRDSNFPTGRVYTPATFHRLQPKPEGKDLYLVNPDFPKQSVLKRDRSSAPDFMQMSE
jgi:hypothetical protein